MSNDLTVYLDREDSFGIQVKVNGTILDLTDGAIWFAIKLAEGDADAAAVLKKQVPITTPDPVGDGAHANLVLAAAEKKTAGLNPLVSYFYDFLVVDDTGRPLPCDDLSGRLSVVRTICQSAA